MYSEKVMDHFQHPRNVGEIENASGVGTVGNAKCGDIMRIYLDIDENQIIRDVKFKTFGCGAAVATSSMATELVKGKINPGGNGGNKQSRNGSAGRTSAGKSTLLTSCRRSNSCSTLGLCSKNMVLRSKDLRNQSHDIHEGEEDEEEEY